MKKLLVIPDYKYEEDWENKRPYYSNFVNTANKYGWEVIHINQKFFVEEIDCIYAANYANYIDNVHSYNIYNNLLKTNIPKIISIFESPTRRPDLWEATKHFDVCISFNKKPKEMCRCEHVESPYPYNFANNKLLVKDYCKRKAIVWVASNNWFAGKDSLSQKRLRDFSFFTKQIQGEHALYGIGWDKPKGLLRGHGIFKGVPQIIKNQKCFRDTVKYWYGMVENKAETSSNYLFNFCYENTDNYPGYVTEKIFDAWTCGCVPIYWGEKDFEEKYLDLMIAPRISGYKKSIKIMNDINEYDVISILNRFSSLMEKGEFNNFSHIKYQDKVFNIASTLV